MKSAQSKQDADIPSNTEGWIEIAKIFGEKCLAIQQDTHLKPGQKLEKQATLSKKMSQDIKEDLSLKNEDKTAMLKSIKTYMEDCTKLHDFMQSQEGKNITKDQKEKAMPKKRQNNLL